MTGEEDRPEAIACRHCGAEPGQPCRTPAGRKCEAHLPRRRAYRRRMAGRPLIVGDSPIARAALAEQAARDQLDRP